MRKINTRKLEKPQLSEDSKYRIEFGKLLNSYRKVNGEIYGLFGVCWSYIYQDSEGGEITDINCYPKSYKIYTPDGEWIDATKDSLDSVLGFKK